jgi:hypothetical protein
MTGDARDTPIHRMEGLLRRRRAGAADRIRPANFSGQVAPLIAAGGEGASGGPVACAHEPDRIPWLEGAEYQYRLGRHALVLAIRGMTERQEAAVGRAEAEFALGVEGPLLVIGYRFGDVVPWSWTAPYNWHFMPPAERVMPAATVLTPETYARLWATLWIILLDAEDGRVRIRRAVALRPEFTHALHGELRAQALRPFQGADADRALDRLRYAATPLLLRARVRTKCAAVSDDGGRWAPTRAG